MSPMRTRGEDGGAGRQYNPQAYGQLAGNGGAFVPRPQEEEGMVFLDLSLLLSIFLHLATP
jgi:hypothetical protein